MKERNLFRTIPALLLAFVALGVLMLLLGEWGVGAPSAQAQGAIRYVAPGGDCGTATPCYSTIQAAVDAAANGDEIRIATGTYNENVTIGKSLTVRGGYTTTDWTTSNPISYPTVVNGGGNDVLTVNQSNVTVTLESLEVAGGNYGLLIGWDLNDVNLVIRNCYLHNNQSSGVLVDLSSGSVLIEDCRSDDNSDRGIYVDVASGDVTIRNCDVDGNGYDGIFVPLGNGSSALVEDCRATNNGTAGTAVGISISGPSSNLSNVRITLRNNVITGTNGYGARILWNTNCTVTGNVVAQNSPYGGLDVFCNDGVVTDNRIWGNSYSVSYESYFAGGLEVNGPLLVSNNVITGNTAAGSYNEKCAGGLYASGSAIVRNNIITGNTSTVADSAGSVYAAWGDAVLENNVIADNSGGRAVVFLSANTSSSCTSSDAYRYELVHNTVARNGNGTAIYVSAPTNSACPATAYITNTIVYSHGVGVDAVSPSAAYLYNSILSNTNNMSGNVTVGAGVVYTDPLFLSDGYHISATSPAKDAGTGGPFDYTDIDGQPRLMGPATDIGVDEIVYTTTVSLSKARQGSGVAEAGQPIAYVLTVSNAASSVWQPDVRVVDVITSPYGLAGLSGSGGNNNVACQAGSSVITCTYQNIPTNTAYFATVVVTPAVPGGQTPVSWVITDTATMEVLDAYDPVITDDVAGPVTVTVNYVPPTPDLWVSKSAPRFAKPLQTITYTLQWGNQGGASAENVVLTDTLPEKVNFVGADGSYTRNGRFITWTLGTVNAGVSHTYLITVTTLTGLSDGTVITNTAGITTTSGGDPVLNNTAIATTTIYQLGGVSLQFTKQSLTDKATPYTGQVLPDTIVYELQVYNDGQVDANVTVEDPIPQGTGYKDGSAKVVAGGGTVQYDAGNNKIVWNGNIPQGQTVRIQFEVYVVSCENVECGVIRNTATAKVNGVSYVWEAQADTTILCPDLYVDPDIPENVFFRTDDFIEYEVVVNYGNRGDHKAPGTEIIARLGSEDAYFASANPLPSEQPTNRRWIWQLGDLDAGDTGVLRILIRVDRWNDNGYLLNLDILTVPDWYECESKRADNNADGVTYPAKVTIDKKGRIQYNPGAKDGPRFEVEYVVYSRYRNANPYKPLLERLRMFDLWPPEIQYLKALWNWGGPTYYAIESSSVGLSAQESQEMHWDSPHGIAEGSQVYGRLYGYVPAYSISAGKTITNRARLTGTLKKKEVVSERKGVTVTNRIPLLPPKLIFPGTGQWCRAGEMKATVMAQPGTTVTLWLQGSDGGRSFDEVKPVGPSGVVDVDFGELENYNLQGDDVVLWGKIKDSLGRTVTKRLAHFQMNDKVHWNPQLSYWEGTVKAGPLKGQHMKYHFLDPMDGYYSTSDWQMPGVYGFWNTTAFIVPCRFVCPEGQYHVIVIEADGNEYEGKVVERQGVAGWEFNIGAAHDVKIKSQCRDADGNVISEQVNGGQILIDPDGFVFNVDKGGGYDPNTGMFSPIEAVPGVTVTCYVSEPEWGGWIPWPAHLYDQVNPQNTNSTYPDGITTTGYFAFFTPPGFYYLEVEGIPGYQRWRSPVIEVVTQIVHVNVPYTPLPDTAAVTVTLTPDGPDPAVVTITAGSAVQWVSQVREGDTITDVVHWTENPILRPLSALDPLQNPLGFDAGYLEPGQGYRRRFAIPGEYTYTDAAGHTGKVVVTGGAKIYLPAVFKDYRP